MLCYQDNAIFLRYNDGTRGGRLVGTEECNGGTVVWILRPSTWRPELFPGSGFGPVTYCSRRLSIWSRNSALTDRNTTRSWAQTDRNNKTTCNTCRSLKHPKDALSCSYLFRFDRLSASCFVPLTSSRSTLYAGHHHGVFECSSPAASAGLSLHHIR